jgi:regulator of protease activity HflC (stomatin/prohibitin superfamily)
MNQSAAPLPRQRPMAPLPHRFVRRLTLIYTVAALAALLPLLIPLLPTTVFSGAHSLVAEATGGGLAATVLAALSLAVTALSATLALTWARYRPSTRFDPGVAARQGQALIVPLGATAVSLCAVLLWPKGSPTAMSGNANVVAAFVFALAFVSLVAERTMHAFPGPQLPEAPSLRRLLLLVTLLLVASGCAELGRGAGLQWVRWPTMALIALPCAVAIELAVRALARMFLPAPVTTNATAVTTSILATVLTGGPRAPGTLLRTHLGLDFARSWALSYLSAALLPAVFVTALFCWGLSGVKLIDLGERGIYERFGAPVGVLSPGLHVLLPWPLGRLRTVEYGTIHSVAIGVDQSEDDTDAAISAEALPPPSLNRLWESAHPGQAEYLVASASTGLQGFQTVSTEISVLYRVGLSDAAALQSVYTVAEPQMLVKEAASRLVLRYFNSRTLDAVLGAKRENIAEALRDSLSDDLNSRHAGIDVVSVLIQEIHPPAGAAAAYHAVQAAQINAMASVSNEIGRAKRTAGTAQQEAHQFVTAAAALAEETVRSANAEAYQFNADRRAYGDGGKSFLFERSNRNIVAALMQTPLTIVDHRLNSTQGPIIDLRTLPAPNVVPTPPPSVTPEVDSDN